MKIMLPQIKILARTELCNLFGLNVLRFSKDKRIKRRFCLLAAAYVLLAVIMMTYVGALSYGLCLISLWEVVPAYLITISSLLIFFFGLFKAGESCLRKRDMRSFLHCRFLKAPS